MASLRCEGLVGRLHQVNDVCQFPEGVCVEPMAPRLSDADAIPLAPAA